MDMKETNARVIAQFRAGGEIQGMHRDRLVLLTTKGARTGAQRTAPMMFVRDGDRLLVIASNAGAPRAPQWYRNLLADPHVRVEVADEQYEAKATSLEGEAYESAWRTVTGLYPFFLEHERKARRRIPVVALERVEADRPRRDG